MTVTDDNIRLFCPISICCPCTSPFVSQHGLYVLQVQGIGLLNIFMCQFPFDLDAYIDSAGLATLSGYDYVLLNSKFSYKVCVKC